MRIRLVLAAALLAPTAALSGCGTSGSPDSSGQFVQSLNSDASREGTVFSTGAVSFGIVKTGDLSAPSGIVGTGGGSALVAGGVVNGVMVNGESLRGFVSFTRALPPGATLVNATLEVFPTAFITSPPNTLFASMGNVIADHVDLGAGLDASDFAAAALQSDIGTILSSQTLGAVLLDVTSSVSNDIANARPRSEFRIRFQNLTDNDFSEDSAQFGSSTTQGFEPHLILTYTLPGFNGIPYDHNVPN
jgi:hypothetical protein